MNVCGIELKGNEAIICLLSLSDGLFELPECRLKRLALNDVKQSKALTNFQFTFAKLMEDYKVSHVVIRERPTKGKFSGGAIGFKMEAAIQLIPNVEVQLLNPSTIKELISKNPLPIPFKETGLKAFQEPAFLTAYAYQAEKQF